VRCMKLWAQSDLRVKLVGLGPDLLKKSLSDAYGKEIIAYCNLTFDNAHNEVIQYLLTLGVSGAASHLVMVFASMRRLSRAADPFARAALFAVSAYFVHSLISLNQPVTSPLMFMLMFASVSFAGAPHNPPVPCAE